MIPAWLLPADPPNLIGKLRERSDAAEFRQARLDSDARREEKKSGLNLGRIRSLEIRRNRKLADMARRGETIEQRVARQKVESKARRRGIPKL